MKTVKVYSTPFCGYCLQAKTLLSNLGVAFVEIDLSKNHQLREELVEKYHWQTVPMIFIGEEFIGGYQDLAMRNKSGKLADLLA